MQSKFKQEDAVEKADSVLKLGELIETRGEGLKKESSKGEENLGSLVSITESFNVLKQMNRKFLGEFATSMGLRPKEGKELLSKQKLLDLIFTKCGKKMMAGIFSTEMDSKELKMFAELFSLQDLKGKTQRVYSKRLYEVVEEIGVQKFVEKLDVECRQILSSKLEKPFVNVATLVEDIFADGFANVLNSIPASLLNSLGDKLGIPTSIPKVNLISSILEGKVVFAAGRPGICLEKGTEYEEIAKFGYKDLRKFCLQNNLTLVQKKVDMVCQIYKFLNGKELDPSLLEPTKTAVKKKRGRKRKIVKEEPKDDQYEPQDENCSQENAEKKGFVVVCCSGELRMGRDMLKDSVIAKGFRFSDVVQNSTHIVCNNFASKSKKMNFARKNNVIIVHENWFSSF